jgi:hypothetical protein
VIRLPALCAVLALGVLAGCSPAPEQPTVATAASPPSATAAAPTSPSPKAPTDYDKALAYTRCMTANGATTPDPVVGEALVTVNTVHRGDTLADLTAKRNAYTKCKQLLPTTWPLKVDAKEVARIAKFVACVRKHGVDWPQTDENGLAAWPTDPNAMATPAYDAAVRACRSLVDDPANALPENQ